MEKVVKFHDEKAQNKIKMADDIFENIRDINIDYSQENVLIFYLNTQLHLIDSEVVFKGGVNECCLDARIVFRKALAKNAVAVIVAHNHPSGNLTPSSADIETFSILKKGGEILDINVLDSVIFSKDKYISMLDEGVFL